MDQRDVERVASDVLARAGMPDDCAPRVRPLVEALLGPGALRMVDGRALRGDAALARVGGRWAVYVRRGISPERARHAALHEVGEYELARMGVAGWAAEDAADRIAAALCAPRRAFCALAEEAEARDSAALAEAFRVTQSAAALRIGEVHGAPIALVTPSRVRVRGGGELPSERRLRAAARASVPGLRAVRLSDEPGRVVVVVA